MPPWIIFHGEGFVSPEEAEYYDSLGLGWHFQPDAWADAAYSRKWLRAFVGMLKANGLGDYGHLLFLDDLKTQTMARFINIALQNKVYPFPIPGGSHTHPLCCLNQPNLTGLTDLLQPVDSHVAAHIKHLMSVLYKIELEMNYEEWRSYQTSGALSAMKRRMLMARWLHEAWRFMKLNPYVIHQAFRHTVLVKLDGSHDLRYRGLDNYQPPNVEYSAMCSTVCSLT